MSFTARQVYPEIRYRELEDLPSRFIGLSDDLVPQHLPDLDARAPDYVPVSRFHQHPSIR